MQVRDEGIIFILTGNIPTCLKTILGGGGWSYLSGVLNVNSFPEIMSTTGENENDEIDYLGA